MKKIKLLFVGLVLTLTSIEIQAQQLPYTSPLQEMHHIWNPAFTAPGTLMEASAFYRKQWFGFDNAPNTAFASIQYPFVDMNMSAGGAIISDKTGPVSKFGIELNYAYKLREIFSDEDQISLGINGYMFQYSFNPGGEKFNDPDDPLFGTASQSGFNPSLGVGFAYFSATEEYGRDNIFYFGLATLQSFSPDLNLASGKANREQHIFGNIGVKWMGYGWYLEPSLQVNYVRPELIDYIIGMKYEMEETFWAGIALSSVNDYTINGGIIMNDINGRYTSLKIGAVAGINGSLGTGPSFEFYIAYRADMD
ncbi:MAG: PorP/SprF family type IX secretion system membrane protein [Saprospiraceae bacterium]|nr:PorP/SprF family type IX secretion system membrane protein [Bacteroidia bacterium]MBT8230543.1 PorP/SprF family type IX secretion system membrane protein [Bacteroidia bacterium]NNF21035.1 PorP/SprF family type IX secretion system membrane protein [Saprospiraceae bacterium]NNK89784.1 PorP/SprF family type IX secretion system membrane protein [Saprospiraceae bacterium]